MKAEIIAVGTELLLGQIVNTNAQYLSQGLAALGIDVYFQTVVGDNAGRIRQAIETARRRADLLLFTGGLGPTQDDLTKDVLADYLGRKLILHEPSMRKIEARLAGRAVMIESNRRQALMIEGSEPLPNETGLAVGNALTADGTHYVLLPGPPGEMRPMFDGPATEWLLRQLGESRPLYSMTLRFAGIGESALEDLLIDLIKRQTDPTIAPYAKEGEVAIRLSTKAADEAEAAARLTREWIEIVERDTQGEPTQAVAATRALVQEGVSAIWFTTEAFPPVQDYLNQVKIPGATAGGIGAVLPDVGDSKKYKYAFSTGAGTSGETSIIPLLAYAASAGDTVAMLDDSSAFGTAQSELTKTIAERDFPNVTIVHKTFPSTASDNTAELSELRDSGAQSLIVWSYGAPLVTTMNSLNRIGWNPQMSGVLGIGDPSVSELIPEGMKETLAAGPIAKTFVSSTPGAEPTGIAAEFVKLYLKLRNKTDFNALDTVGAMSFDWALLVAEAVKRAGSTDGEAIKNQLVSADEFEGANGTYTFGPDKRIGLDADDLSVFVPAKPCENNICVEASIG